MPSRFSILILLALHLCCGVSLKLNAGEPVRITSWNIEHLGSPGRGFGGGYSGFGNGSIPENYEELPPRTKHQLTSIAEFIHTELRSDILSLQEVGITGLRLGRSRCGPLESILDELNQKAPDGKWSYFVPQVLVTPEPDDERNTHLGFAWNQNRVRLLNVFEMDLENQLLAGKNLFDRKPLVGYFEEITSDGSEGSDFVLVNVHFASGQQYGENHLIAMTLIEHELTRNLARHGVSEPSITILGDLNHNLSQESETGTPLTSPALMEHMEFKGYANLVSASDQFTRMNTHLNSLIDHILVNQPAQASLAKQELEIYRPGEEELGNTELFPEWRKTYSDHFPLTFEFRSGSDEDDDFFD